MKIEYFIIGFLNPFHHILKEDIISTINFLIVPYSQKVEAYNSNFQKTSRADPQNT